ncbi:MAG: hypothetical protein OEZ02_15510 [Anaerolineae bacterium]|nr:hypothetical protein [Anaerolineae bacterium]
MGRLWEIAGWNSRGSFFQDTKVGYPDDDRVENQIAEDAEIIDSGIVKRPWIIADVITY